MDGGLSQIGSFTLFVEPNTRRHTVSTLSTGFGSGYLFLYFRSGFLVERPNGQTHVSMRQKRNGWSLPGKKLQKLQRLFYRNNYTKSIIVKWHPTKSGEKYLFVFC